MTVQLNHSIDPPVVCAICLDDFDESSDKIISKLVCHHIFHKTCMKEWSDKQKNLNNAVRCPLCFHVIEAREEDESKFKWSDLIADIFIAPGGVLVFAACWLPVFINDRNNRIHMGSSFFDED